MRWVLPLGALGAATGAIAIGTVATLRSTTIIITIRTTISTAMSAARDRVIGSTIRNTAEMHPMVIGKQRISTAARLEAKAEGGPVLELELVLVQAELEHVPVAVLELETDPGAAQAPVIGPVAALELVIDLVVVELGLPIGPVAALERGPVVVPELAT